jgi:hypothetical protein
MGEGRRGRGSQLVGKKRNKTEPWESNHDNNSTINLLNNTTIATTLHHLRLQHLPLPYSNCKINKRRG